ncbi:MAG: hypothetical protein ACE5GE_17275, partial [Phycisphaerae bacterium]
AALKRKADAWALLTEGGEGHSRGAIYLGGYAIECKLKALAMERYHCSTLKDLEEKRSLPYGELHTHGLIALLRHLQLYDKLRRSEVGRDFANYVGRWTPHWRYNPRNWPEAKARAFLEAVDRVYVWLDNNRY